MLNSKTYKFRAPGVSDHAIYFTIVGGAEPTMLFLNSKEMESFQWITLALSGLVRQIEAGVDMAEIIKDMVETLDPNGAYMIPDGTNRMVNSIVHHMGLILEQHIKNPMEGQANVQETT